MGATYGEVWSRIAAAVPERTAIVAGDRTLTYAEFEAEATRFAGLLAEHRIGPGSPVAVFMYNRVEYMVALFATLRIGAPLVPVNFRYGAHEVAGLLEGSRAEALVFPTSLEATAADAVDLGGRPLTLVRVDDGPAGERAEDSEAGATDGAGRRAGGAAVGFDDAPAVPDRHLGAPPPDGELYLFTGGTTGRPKAVVWPIDALLAIQMVPIYTTVGLDLPGSLDEMVGVAAGLGDAAPVVLPLAPFMHGTALFNSMNCFVLGGTLVILPTARFDPVAALRAIEEHAVTRLIVAGDSVAIPLLDAAADLGITRLPSLRTAISSGMRFGDGVKARLHALGSVSIADVLAATEGGPFAIATSTSADDLPARLSLLPDAVVLDDDLHEIQDEPGRIGLVAYRGTLPKGYLGDPDKTATTYPVIGGVRHLVPGDYVRVEEDRHIELLGRGSSVINTGGEKIYPAEVEEALLDHPAVVDAVVFGVPDPRWGEAVSAVVAAPAGPVTEDDLIAHVGARLAGYKKPKRVLVRATIERSPSGKVDMARLRQDVLDAAGTT
jgi:fatty-acyl-CoA synthase